MHIVAKTFEIYFITKISEKSEFKKKDFKKLDIINFH